MFPSTLLKFTLCAILASAVGVNAQSADSVTCSTLAPAPFCHCKTVVDVLHRINQAFPNVDGQANFTLPGTSCMAKVLFNPPDFFGIDAGTFAANVDPILAKCNSDPMSGEALPAPGGHKFQLFNSFPQ